MTQNKLLVLGAYPSDIEIIREAQKMGLFVISTDNHLDWNLAPAKKVADEAWDISWSDIEALKVQCEESGVAGIMAGFSERRIQCAQKLCTALGKPFYADGAKLNSITDKVLFKQACIDSGITVPKAYQYGDKIVFPVIVKPADNGGSKGITVCHYEEEFEPAYQKAMNASDNKTVVIEQYIVADETMVYFTVHNGIADVSAMCDRYMHHFGTDITQLPIGYFYPSKHLDVFLNYNLEKFKRLIHNLGIKNGLIAFQSFVVGNGVIPFDPTYRLDGTMTYHICEAISGANVLRMLINYSMNGYMGNDEEISKTENPFFSKIGFQLPVLLRKGTIKSISGLDAVKALQNVIHVHQIHFEGETLTKEADFSQILCRIHMVAESINSIRQTVKEVYDILKVVDESENDMVICRMDLERIGN